MLAATTSLHLYLQYIIKRVKKWNRVNIVGSITNTVNQAEERVSRMEHKADEMLRSDTSEEKNLQNHNVQELWI